MQALLMHRNQDFDVAQELPRHARALTQDLDLDTLLHAMADGDEFLFDVARHALFSGLQNDVDTILYRQAVLKDCLKNPAVVRALYDIAVEAIETKWKQRLGIFSNYPRAVLHDAINLMRVFTGILRRLRNIAQAHASQFESEACRALFEALQKELSHEYLASIEDHLDQLQFRAGVLMSAELGKGNAGKNYVLRKPRAQSWVQQLLGKRPPAFSFRIHPRDEAGARALSELRDRGIHLAALTSSEFLMLESQHGLL